MEETQLILSIINSSLKVMVVHALHREREGEGGMRETRWS
jgi:hypothetical protein